MDFNTTARANETIANVTLAGSETALSDMEKPKCGGSGGNLEDYDFPLHLAAIFIVFFASIAGAGFPVIARRVRWMKVPPKIFFFCKHFGTGVLVATAFVHLVPTAFASLSDPCLPDLLIKDYPAMPGVIMMGSLFALFLIEVYLKGKTGGHSHGGPTGEGLISHAAPHGISAPISAPMPYRPRRPDEFEYPDEKKNPFVSENEIDDSDDEGRRSYDGIDQYGTPTEMPPWFQAFFARYVRQREELKSAIAQVSQSAPAYTLPAAPVMYSAPAPKGIVYKDEHVEMDEATFKKMSLNITLLEGGILFHSIFVGMTISITTDGFIILLVAILFHQFFEGLGLGSRIAAIPYPRGTARPWVLVCAFGLTCPIGQAIGLATRNSYDPASEFALILVGVFNAISSGLLIYAATVDLLAEDFLSEEAQDTMDKSTKVKAFIYVFMGAAGMAVVGAFA